MPATKISAHKVEQFLVKEFNFKKSNITNISHLVGYDNDNFQISTSDNKKYILKIFPIYFKKEDLEAQFAAVDLLYENLPNGLIAKALRNTSTEITTPLFFTNDGSNEQIVRHCVLSPWLPGEPLQNLKKITETQLMEIGKFVGNVSSTLITLPNGRHKDVLMSRSDYKWNTLNLSVCKRLINCIKDGSRRASVKDFFEEWENEIQPRIACIEHCVIYGDFNGCNILISPGPDWKIIGLIDFEDVGIGTISTEVGNLITYMDMFEAYDVLSIGSHLLRGFSKSHSLSLQEVDLLFYLVKARCVMSSLYGLHQHSLNPENNYLIQSQEFTWRTYLTLEKLGYDLVTRHWRNAAGY